MKKEILDYIQSQRVGVISLEMMDGSPHGATIHFAHIDNPLTFFFETSKKYRKYEPLSTKDITRASFVIGSDESDMKTLQLDGTAELISKDDITIINSVYLDKFPEKKEKSKGEDLVFFKFNPKWWRYTDWTGPNGKKIISSEDKNI